MKFRQFLLLLAISMPFLLSADTKPEAFCRPAEIIAGSLPRPQEGVLWNAVGDGFEEWKVTGPGTLSLGNEYYLWDDQAARVEFSGKGRVTLAPNPAITIDQPVSGVSFWVICPPSGKTTNLLQIKDAKGKKFTIKTRNNSSYWANNPWWCTSSFLIPCSTLDVSPKSENLVLVFMLKFLCNTYPKLAYKFTDHFLSDHTNESQGPTFGLEDP